MPALTDPLDVALAIRSAATQNSVVETLVTFSRPLGYPWFTIGRLPGPHEAVGEDFFYSNVPAEWSAGYYDHDLQAHDPVGRAAAVVDVPMTLGQIVAGEAGFALDDKAHEVLDFGASLGMRAALVVPVFGAFGYRGLVCFTGPGPDPSLKDQLGLAVVGREAHNRLMILQDMRATVLPEDLSEREKQVLAALRAGMRDDAIAASLGIAVRTVRFHINNAREKLGCRTRAEAIVRAVALNLI